jgi:hypothetical protein
MRVCHNSLQAEIWTWDFWNVKQGYYLFDHITQLFTLLYLIHTHTKEDIQCVNKMWRKMPYRFRHLHKYCVRTGTLHKVQHCRMPSVSQLITHWQTGVSSRRCRRRLRVALSNTWGPRPVNPEIFKLKLKMYRCCTFYNSARPGWLRRTLLHGVIK